MRKTWQVLLGNRSYLLFSVGVFALGLLLGVLFDEQFLTYVKEGLEHIKELAEKAEAKNNPLYTSQIIFLNNLRAAVFMLLLGSLFSVFTLAMLLINGLMIGVVFAITTTATTVSLFNLIVYGLVPHGIFELPAIFIASAFGIKLGKVLMMPLSGKTRWESYKLVWREVAQISWLVLLLLVVAAGVEGLITPQLLETYAK